MIQYKITLAKWDLAHNPNTPIETLEELSKDEEIDVRIEVALNKNTPKEILTELSKSENLNVRLAVAQNPNTAFEALMYLSKEYRFENIVDCAKKNRMNRMGLLK